MFTWAMDHGYEIIVLAAQPPELKHAKCINAVQKKKMPGAIRQCNKRSLNDISQLILWIYRRQVHTYELRPAISAQPSGPKCAQQYHLLFGNDSYTRNCNDQWHFPTHSVTSQGP